MNLELWTLVVAIGFNAAVSVRVSNELGPGRPKAAEFSVVVAVSMSALFGILFTAAVLIARSHFEKLFTDKPEVIRETMKLGYLLAATIFLNSIQPVLHGNFFGMALELISETEFQQMGLSIYEMFIQMFHACCLLQSVHTSFHLGL